LTYLDALLLKLYFDKDETYMRFTCLATWPEYQYKHMRVVSACVPTPLRCMAKDYLRTVAQPNRPRSFGNGRALGSTLSPSTPPNRW